MAPAALRGAVAEVIHRDTTGSGHDDRQRLTHFPASPLLGISWFQGAGSIGWVEAGESAPRWEPFAASVMVTGSQSRPTVTWSPVDGRGGMICFTADIARELFGIDPRLVSDRCASASAVMDSRWTNLFEQLLEAPDEAAISLALQQHAGPRWKQVQRRPWGTPSMGQIGRHWVDRLSLQASEWRHALGRRQVERRIKDYSGRSLRDWQSLVQTESLFFSARARHDAGLGLDWAELAQDEGFSDQSHLIRAVRRIAGFSPGEFAGRFEKDESFWPYRLWV